jgi:hypothetical protein
LHKGRFDQALLNCVAETPNFLIVLSRNCLGRCNVPDDSFQKEIQQAVDTERNIIPIFVSDFAQPPDSRLTDAVKTALKFQGYQYSHVRFQDAINEVVANLDDDAKKPRRCPKQPPKGPRDVIIRLEDVSPETLGYAKSEASKLLDEAAQAASGGHPAGSVSYVEAKISHARGRGQGSTRRMHGED